MQEKIIVRGFAPAESELYKSIRLRALAESPGAFASTHAKESAWSEDEWRARIEQRNSGTTSLTFLAFVDGDSPPIGLVGSVQDQARTDRFWVVSLWVEPLHRNLGIARRLTTAAEHFARERHANEIWLEVSERNSSAIALYTRLGYTRLGDLKPLPSDPSVMEFAMMRRLGAR